MKHRLSDIQDKAIGAMVLMLLVGILVVAGAMIAGAFIYLERVFAFMVLGAVICAIAFVMLVFLSD